MKYLNLSKGFNPYNATEEEEIKFSSFTFSGGEPHIKIDEKLAYETDGEDIMITTRINSPADLVLLCLAKDAIDSMVYGTDIHLFVPYFPGARQDRRMVMGEPLTVKVYASIINSLKFASVHIVDPHSDVAAAVINDVMVIDNHKFVNKAVRKITSCDIDSVHRLAVEHLIVSPDAGSNKKIYGVAKMLKGATIVKCDKVRNTSTGVLESFEVYADDLKGQPCIIVDDICDGGGTFIGLAEELKKFHAGDLFLVVTHGIFSKGFKELRKHFKAIYTTNSIVNDYAWERPEFEKGSEIVNIINIGI